MTKGGRLIDELDVSRETMERLRQFEVIIQKWNPRINLVSKSSLEHLWARHIIDSIQVFRCIQDWTTWLDMGSGGGFPGLIVALLASDENPGGRVTLIESDQRKSAFLRTAARECGVQCTVISDRIESVQPQNADVLSARALADLSQLLAFADRHLSKQGTALFPKGVTWKKELDQARREWQFEAEPITSLTEPDAVILKIQGVARV